MADDLELDPADAPEREVYLLLTALVVPRPIAWISTVDADGVPNLAPHSYFTIASNHPPHIVFSSSAVRDTLTNIRATGGFVVNVVNRDLVEPMNVSSAEFPPAENEFAWAGMTPAPSVRVAPPRVAEARAHLECRAVDELAVGDSHLVVAEVLHIHVADLVRRDGRVSPELLDPIARLSGSGYTSLGEIFRMPRPTWPDISQAGG